MFFNEIRKVSSLQIVLKFSKPTKVFSLNPFHDTRLSHKDITTGIKVNNKKPTIFGRRKAYAMARFLQISFLEEWIVRFFSCYILSHLKQATQHIPPRGLFYFLVFIQTQFGNTARDILHCLIYRLFPSKRQLRFFFINSFYLRNACNRRIFFVHFLI